MSRYFTLLDMVNSFTCVKCVWMAYVCGKQLICITLKPLFPMICSCYLTSFSSYRARDFVCVCVLHCQPAANKFQYLMR